MFSSLSRYLRYLSLSFRANGIEKDYSAKLTNLAWKLKDRKSRDYSLTISPDADGYRIDLDTELAKLDEFPKDLQEEIAQIRALEKSYQITQEALKSARESARFPWGFFLFLPILILLAYFLFIHLQKS